MKNISDNIYVNYTICAKLEKKITFFDLMNALGSTLIPLYIETVYCIVLKNYVSYLLTLKQATLLRSPAGYQVNLAARIMNVTADSLENGERGNQYRAFQLFL